MALKKCKKCKKIFAPAGGTKVCSKCIQEEEDQFIIVKEYLWDNPGTTITKLHEVTEVDEKLIKKFVREGRFLQMRGVDLSVECERCGKAIKSERFCADCSEKLRSGIEKVKRSHDKKPEKPEKQTDKMFLGDRIRRR